MVEEKKENKQGNITVTSLFVGEMSLEDVFVSLIKYKETTKDDKLQLDSNTVLEYDGVTSDTAELQRIGE